MARAKAPEKTVRGRKSVRTFDDKFSDERTALIQEIRPMNEAQALFVDVLKKNQIAVAMGSAGTGKTYMAATHAANQYLRNPSTTIYMSRPYVTMGRSAGLLPGTIEEKMAPFLAPITGVLKSQLGKKYEADFGKSIQVQLIEAIRGLDLKDAILIVDEAQNLTRDEMKSIVTRLGSGSQIILVGDSKQSDLPKGESGLEWLVDLIEKYDIKGCDFVEFGAEDIVRSGIVKRFVEIFDEEGV